MIDYPFRLLRPFISYIRNSSCHLTRWRERKDRKYVLVLPIPFYELNYFGRNGWKRVALVLWIHIRVDYELNGQLWWIMKSISIFIKKKKKKKKDWPEYAHVRMYYSWRRKYQESSNPAYWGVSRVSYEKKEPENGCLPVSTRQKEFITLFPSLLSNFQVS